MFYRCWHEPVRGVSLFWTRVGTVAGIVGWTLIAIVAVVAPIWAAIYHATH